MQPTSEARDRDQHQRRYHPEPFLGAVQEGLPIVREMVYGQLAGVLVRGGGKRVNSVVSEMVGPFHMSNRATTR